MISGKRRKTLSFALVGTLVVLAYSAGQIQGTSGNGPLLIADAQASGGGTVAEGWTPSGAYPTQEVYYPGTEALAEDEIRVIACGSGMPMPITFRMIPIHCLMW